MRRGGSSLSTSFPPSPSLFLQSPCASVSSLNNTSQSNQINHPHSTSSPGGLFGDRGTIFPSLYHLLEPNGTELRLLSAQHDEQSIWDRGGEKARQTRASPFRLCPHGDALGFLVCPCHARHMHLPTFPSPEDSRTRIQDLIPWGCWVSLLICVSVQRWDHHGSQTWGGTEGWRCR